ncbi:MAG: hypothetical protein ACREO5_00740 [Candidatus Binatia bacterium]
MLEITERYASDEEIMGQIEFGDELVDKLLEQNPRTSLIDAQLAAGKGAMELYPVVEEIARTNLPEISLITGIDGLKLELQHKRKDA